MGHESPQGAGESASQAQFAILEKKAPDLEQVNQPLLQVLHPEQVEVELCRSEELDRRRGLTSELDEMLSFVRSKAHPRWLWHAIDHHTRKVLAYVFGRRKDDAQFLTLCSAYNPEEAWRVSSLWQGSSPAKTRASSMLSRAHGPHL
jgi:IS1 transposase